MWLFATVGVFASDVVVRDRWGVCKRCRCLRALGCLQAMSLFASVGVLASDVVCPKQRGVDGRRGVEAKKEFDKAEPMIHHEGFRLMQAISKS
jgi:hypothetical protein